VPKVFFVAIGDPGTDFQIFSPKKLAFFAQTAASFCKKMIITLVFAKNANFFA
jgi:hypothetical protein